MPTPLKQPQKRYSQNSFSGIEVFRETTTITLPETYTAPENRPSQKGTSIPTIDFRVLHYILSERVHSPDSQHVLPACQHGSYISTHALRQQQRVESIQSSRCGRLKVECFFLAAFDKMYIWAMIKPLLIGVYGILHLYTQLFGDYSRPL